MEGIKNKARRATDYLCPKSQTGRALVIAGLILATIAFLFTIFINDWSNRSAFKEVADIFQSSIMVCAIVIGGIFALVKLQAFRDFEPHLTVSHKIFHRFIGDNYVHIDVTATLHNSSKVHIELKNGFFRLQQIAPTSDKNVEELYAQVFGYEEHEEIQWPKLDEVERTWDKDELIVEPGESHPETYEFIVSTDIESVLIYTYFYNSKFRAGGRAGKGWQGLACDHSL